MYFYINNSLVGNIPFENFYGDNLGFVIEYQQKIEIDYLYVTGTIINSGSDTWYKKIKIWAFEDLIINTDLKVNFAF